MTNLSVQRYLSGLNNLVREASLDASSVQPSQTIERLSAVREGGGQVKVGGAYQGHEAAQLEVEIVADGGIPRASVPTFSGVGSGRLEIDDVDGGAPLQSLTFTLADLGVRTEHATLELRGVTLRARTAGTPGNRIRITVEPNLTLTGTDYSLLSDWSSGTATQSGNSWDFGGFPLSPTGELDPASPRIAFGDDPQIYRPYREYKDGVWRYGLSPALERSIAAGTRVSNVTGNYRVTINDGSVSEEYDDDIVTFHDLLTALGGSALLEVAGIVVADRRPGGQAALDVPLRTSAWLQTLSGKVRLQQLAVPPQAPTQKLIVRCINAEVIGRERWSVTGNVSGALETALTGQLYTSAAISFLLPAITPAATSGEWSFKYSPAPRRENEGLPSICIRPFRFGRNARAKTVTFRYQLRPPPDCKCSDMPTPKLSMNCLGLEGGDPNMALDAEYQSRLEELFKWRAEFISGNTRLARSNQGFNYLYSDSREIEIVNGSTSVLAEGLAEIYEVPRALTEWDQVFESICTVLQDYDDANPSEVGQDTVHRSALIWAPQMNVSELILLKPTVPNGRLYLVRQAGELGETEPEWDTLSNPIISGTAVLEALPEYWKANTSVKKGEVIVPGNGQAYIAQNIGTTGTQEPFWPLGSDNVVDGDVRWTTEKVTSSQIHLASDFKISTYDIGPNSWSSDDESSRRNYMVELYGRGWRKNIQSLNRYPKGMEDRLRWVAEMYEAMNLSHIANSIEPFVNLVTSRMDYCRTLAGIVPKSDASSGAGACWRDDPDETHWWADVEGYYLPAFSNQPYISARRNTETGQPYSTMEFGFGLVVACPERLKEGDQITLRLEQVDAEKPYQVGDEAVIETIAAGPAWLTGGVDGTDELTWRVVGSASGALPDYIVPLDRPASWYQHSGVNARIQLGGIPFALGDRFDFSVEAGQFRWRQAEGAWSAVADIPANGEFALPGGLAMSFIAGAAPSFVPGDHYRFAVHQPYAVSHLCTPSRDVWRWQEDAAVITADFGALRTVSCVALARYALPQGATVSASLSEDGLSWSPPIPLPLSQAVSVASIAPLPARYLRLDIAGARGGRIGWLWAGEPLATTYHASSCRRSRQWAVSRGDGINASSLYAGCGDGWQLEWDACLHDRDARGLMAMADWMQAHDEAIILLPHHLHPEDASLVVLGTDALDIVDIHEYQPNRADDRLLSATLTLEPVLS